MWVAHLKQHGFDVTSTNVPDMTAVKRRVGVPAAHRRRADTVHLNGDLDRGPLIRKAHHPIALPGHMKERSRLLRTHRATEEACHRGVGGEHAGPLRPQQVGKHPTIREASRVDTIVVDVIRLTQRRECHVDELQVAES